MHSESLAEKTTLDDPELSDAAPVSVSDVNNLSAFSNGAFPSEVGFIDIYDLDVVSKLPEEPPTSFIAAYARGDWVPNSIPPMPLGFQGIIGDGSDATTAGVLISPKRLSPPAILESVEEAYRSYLEETRSQISPITTHSSASQTPLSDGIQNIFEQEFREATLASSPSHGESPEPTISISTRTPPSSSEVSCISPSSLSAASQRRYEMNRQCHVTKSCVGTLCEGMISAPLQNWHRLSVSRYQPYHTGIDPDLNRILRLGKLMFSV
ncbi:hypothetical protein FRB91_000599 [Serendipita sp. 411]|nr:hypothetical protein FRB91_000599 [Serendipita sp. 411]